jgi:hypothetical protein
MISDLVAGNREDKFIPFIRRMGLNCNGYVGRRQPPPTSNKNEEGKRKKEKGGVVREPRSISRVGRICISGINCCGKAVGVHQN